MSHFWGRIYKVRVIELSTLFPGSLSSATLRRECLGEVIVLRDTLRSSAIESMYREFHSFLGGPSPRTFGPIEHFKMAAMKRRMTLNVR